MRRSKYYNQQMQKNQQNQSTNIKFQDLFVQIQSQYIDSIVMSEPHSNYIQPQVAYHDQVHYIQQTINVQNKNEGSQLKQEQNLLTNDTIYLNKVKTDRKDKKSCMPPCLKKICQQLLLSQIQFISSLTCISGQLKACIKYLKQQNILPEQICDQLFSCQEQGSNWHNMQQISKNFSKKFSNFLINGQHSSILQKLQGIQSLQIVYKQQYTRIGKILQIISYIEDKIKKYLLQVEQNKKIDKNKSKQTNTYYKQILNHRTSQKRIVSSEIVDDEYIETKFKSTYRMPKKKQEHPFFYNKTIQQQRQYIKTPANYLKCKNLIQICINIKKNIFKPLNKLKQFIHLITRYTHIQMHSYQGIIKQYKQNNKTVLHDVTEYNNFLQQMSKIKKTVIKISAILQNIFGNQFQQMDQYQSTIKQLFYKYPELFCTQYQSQNQQTTPLIIPINTLQIYYMGIPCQLYLINNYIIIIKSHKQNISCGSASKIKNKKNKEVIKLAIVEIDHTTQVQIVSHNMLYQQYIMYVSGGLKSSGVFLQFRAPNIDQEEIKIHKRKCKQYIKQNNIDLSQFKCPICSLQGDTGSKPFHPDSTLPQLQKSTITSNIQILKTIIELNVCYNSFIYYSRLHNINVYTCHKISYWKLDIKKYQNQSEINVIHNEQDKEKILQKQFITGFHCNLEEQTIPNTHLLALRVLAIKYCYLDEQNTQKKYYIIELQVYLYDHFILCQPNAECKNQCKNYHSNQSCITQIVNMSQDKFYQLEEFIFRYYPNVLAVNRISRDQQYLDIMRFQQSRQLFLSSYLPNQNILQRESMMITQLFNTLFKTTQFRNKPQQLLYRLGISDGLWKILVQGVQMNANEYFKFNGKIFKKIQLWCQCEQCEDVPQVQKYEDEYQRLGLKKRMISKFWRYHNQVSLYPYSLNYEVAYKQQIKRLQLIQKYYPQPKIESQFIQPLKNQKRFRQTGCPIFMYRLQKNYINQLILQNTEQKTEKDKEIIMNMNKKQKFYYEILDYFNRVKYIKYLSANYNLYHNNQQIHKKQCGLLNTIVQSSKVRSLNILLYCLPSLNDYYHQLQNTQSRQQQVNKKIFEQISQQNVEIGVVQNHGFTQKLLINIHKDTTCKHLKYIIAQRLEICQDYISHFMQNFILVLVKKQQVKKVRGYFSWLRTNKSKNCTEYCINQMNALQDHQKVYDILDFIKNHQDKYFISIKKNIKTQPILIYLFKSTKNELILNQKKPEQKLIQNYFKLLQLQLAQICYKINHQQLLIDQPNTTLIKYIVMLLSFLQIKLKDRKQRYTQKYSYELDQRLLIKTGVISKSVFDLYYNDQLEQPDSNNRQTYNKILEQNLKTKLSRRKHLQIIYKAQIQVEQSYTEIINKLMGLIYNKTNWNLTIQPVLYIKNTQNKQQLINCHIFINEDGIVINNINASKDNFVNVNTSMLKSRLMKCKTDEVTLLDFDYSQIDVEIFGTVLTLATKKALYDENKQLLQKYNLFSNDPYHLWQLIKYYKILAQKTKVQDIIDNELKIKQQNKKKQRRNSGNIQNYCRNFMKRTLDPFRKEQEQKAYSKLSAQFRRTDNYNLNNGLSDRTQSS